MKQKLSFLTVLALVIGSVIGTGIYFKIGIVFSRVGNDVTLSLIVWIIGGIITLASALVVAELGSRLSDDGGVASLVRFTFGKIGHFFVGWIEVFYLGLLIAAVSFYGADALLSVFNVEKTYMHLTFVGWSLFLSTAFLSRFRQSASTSISKIAVFLNLTPIVMLVIALLFLPNKGTTPLYFSSNGENTSFILALGLALPAVLFAYDGWVFVTTITEETKNPRRTIPLAIVSGVSVVIVAYLLINAVSLMAMNQESTQHLNQIVPYTMRTFFGDFAGKIMAFIIFVSAYGVLNTYAVLTQYLFYGLAEENNFIASRIFIKKDKNNIPQFSSYLMLGFIFLFMILIYFVPVVNQPYLSPEWLSTQASFLSDLPIILIWGVYILAFFSAAYMRMKAPVHKDQFHMPMFLFWITWSIATGSGIFMLLINLFQNPQTVFFSFVTVCSGGVLYFVVQRQNQ